MSILKLKSLLLEKLQALVVEVEKLEDTGTSFEQITQIKPVFMETLSLHKCVKRYVKGRALVADALKERTASEDKTGAPEGQAMNVGGVRIIPVRGNLGMGGLSSLLGELFTGGNMPPRSQWGRDMVAAAESHSQPDWAFVMHLNQESYAAYVVPQTDLESFVVVGDVRMPETFFNRIGVHCKAIVESNYLSDEMVRLKTQAETIGRMFSGGAEASDFEAVLAERTAPNWVDPISHFLETDVTTALLSQNFTQQSELDEVLARWADANGPAPAECDDDVPPITD